MGLGSLFVVLAFVVVGHLVLGFVVRVVGSDVGIAGFVAGVVGSVVGVVGSVVGVVGSVVGAKRSCVCVWWLSSQLWLFLLHQRTGYH